MANRTVSTSSSYEDKHELCSDEIGSDEYNGKSTTTVYGYSLKLLNEFQN